MRRLVARWRALPWPDGLWVLLPGAALAVALVAFSVQRLAESHLAAEAERAAQDWARHMASAVPDIDLVFLGDPPSPQTQERLIGLRGTAGLHRFKFFDMEGRLLLLSDSMGVEPRPADRLPPEQALARRVARSGQSDVRLGQGDGEHLPLAYARIQVPILQAGQMIGTVGIELDQTELAATAALSFRRAALVAGGAMALSFALGALLLQRHTRQARQARDRARYLVEHDLLTGALNRSRFMQLLQQACGEPLESGLAVLYLDLDGLGQVNDRHGLDAGDEVLRQVTARLRGLLRGADLLARVGGDSFAVLQREAIDATAVRSLAQRIVDHLGEPHRLNAVAEPIRMSASVGMALLGVDGRLAEDLMRHADLAMMRARATAPGHWRFYDAHLDHVQQDRLDLAEDLRQAIAMGSLHLHYQPLLGADGLVLSGYEALARWPHPTRGFVSPMDFIALAEESGQIAALGRWVLQCACAEAAQWPDDLSVAVNLSALQFGEDGDVVADVREALRTSGLDPQRLELEITESVLLEHTEQVLATLHALHALGTRIVLDDFGTGQTSLAYLWQFPFEKLKIDRVFTQGLGGDPRVDVIVRSIVTLAHSLSMRVNAEGVETAWQRDALQALGCDELQGYLLGRPQPPQRLLHRETATCATTTNLELAPACS